MIKMERRELFILFVATLFLVLGFLFISTQIVKARTINVDDSGGKDYTKIQDALDNATHGDTIFVYNGTYNESITINKSINLIGDNQMATITNITIQADYVTVSGFTITRSFIGVDISSSNNMVSSNRVTNCSIAVKVSNGNNSFILNNTIEYNADGIFLMDSDNNVVASNSIQGNHGASGIALYDSDNNTITDNIIFGCSSGISFNARNLTQNNTITNNTISDCGVGITTVTTSVNVSSTIITSNTINCITGGIWIMSGNDNNIASNTLSGKGDILLNGSNNRVAFNTASNGGISVIGDNVIISNTVGGKPLLFYRDINITNTPQILSNLNAGGIILYNCSGMTIENTTIEYGGIILTQCSGIGIVRNRLISGSGIHSSSSSYLNISFNEIKDTPNNIYLSETNNCIVFSNTISDCHYVGIWLVWSSNNTIALNKLTDCNCDAISLYYSNRTNISSNTITNFGDNGIEFFESDNNTISTNTVVSSFGCGLNIIGSDNNTIVSNVITGCEAGSHILGAWNNNITYNNIYANKQFGLLFAKGLVSINRNLNNTALNNWWGSASGPYHSTLNPNGAGDNITDGIEFIPWATSPFNITEPVNYPSTPTITTTPYTDTDGNYALNWTSSNYADKYILDENGTEIYNGTDLSYSFASKPNGTYSYGVRAWNVNGTSANSSEVMITVSIPIVPNLPSAPTITTIEYTDTDGNYTINWTISDYAVNYVLYENNVVVYNGTALSYSFTNKPNGTYAYKVKVWNANGTSADSTEVTLTVQLPAAQASNGGKGFIPGFEALYLAVVFCITLMIVSPHRRKRI